MMSKKGRRETQLQKLFGDFRYLLLDGAGEDQEEGCIQGRRCHLRIENILITVARFINCSFHLFKWDRLFQPPPQLVQILL